jgi:hypothetical protein
MAYSFTAASSQYLTTASTPVTAKPITLAAFAKANTDVFGILVYVGESAGDQRVSILRTDSAQSRAVRAFDFGTSNFNATAATTSVSAADNTLFHAAGILESATSRTAFLNGGSKVTNTVDSGSANAYGQTAIGARYASASWGAFWDGQIAEAAIWNAALTDAEVASLAKGFKPTRIRPQSLVFYAPLIRNLQDTRGGLAITNNNSATVAEHPRVY